MSRSNRVKCKVIVTALIVGILVLVNEFLVYNFKSYQWPLKKCQGCVTILIVADPQILGEKTENYVGASVARWDNDRYLKKTFTKAVERTKPNVIVFLGDLMDEGHISSIKNFQNYKQRFDNIFETADDLMKIYLPGDNDIGGEEDEVITWIHERFKFAYTQPDSLTYESVVFFKVNRLTSFIPPLPKDAFLNEYTERNTTYVVLSHMPIFFTPGSFRQSVIKELSPQIIFSGHEHEAKFMSYDTATEQFSEIKTVPAKRAPMYQVRLDVGDIHEFQVPTCSYRMGKKDVGFGLAYVDTREKTMDLTILWLPDRFSLLWLYLYVGAGIGAFYLFSLLCCCHPYGRVVPYSRLPLK